MQCSDPSKFGVRVPLIALFRAALLRTEMTACCVTPLARPFRISSKNEGVSHVLHR